MDDALRLLLRDATEAPVLAFFLLLPSALAIVPMLRGSRLALLPPLILIGQITGGLLYYGTDWWANPGMGGVWAYAVLPALLGLFIALATAIPVAAHALSRRSTETLHSDFAAW